jgi:AbrB family looped-hinge helix DNA binding protein
MTAHSTLSSKGQIVIPKDIRDALRLKPGERLTVTLKGRKIIMEPPEPPRQKISFDEFRRRVPQYEGPAIPAEEMTTAIGELYRDWET